MWKDYSESYIKNNRGAAVTIMTAVMTASLFLSLLCSLYYNVWIYELEKRALEGMTVNEAGNARPSLLIPFYLLILAIVSFALILIIRNSFEISMNDRIHQFGIFASIGATPKQIRTCLMQEAAALSVVPLFMGTVLGIGLCYAAIAATNHFLADVPGRHAAVFGYHPAVFGLTIGAAVLTVLFSAWMPARKLSRMTPLEAIRGTEAGRLKAQKKQLAFSRISLLLSFLGFSLMLCFFTLSGISTRFTYFERYQDVWDVMAAVKNTELADFMLTEEVKNIPGVRDAVCYEKKELRVQIEDFGQSEELQALGGFGTLAGDDDVSVPVIVMDDESFFTYCAQIGAEPSLNGTVVLNRIWDSVNSNFRNKEYIPFVKENLETLAELPVLFYTQEPPILREEYDNYALVQFAPLSLWKTVGEETDDIRQIEIRILAKERNLAELNVIEAEMAQLIGQSFDFESENRIQEKISNDEMIQGFETLLGAFCILLALIGIAGVFTNTLGFLRQRKREFAQYLSIGMTPADMRKIFCKEAALIAGQPIILTLVLTAGAAELMTAASHLERSVFRKEAPVVPILMFALMILIFVALAYYIGGRRVLNCDLSEVLKDDSLR